jgi:hypothetical protein
MENIEKYMSRLEENIVRYQLINEKISASAVGWHIEHTLLTLNAIIGQLLKSKPDEYKWKFNFFKVVILTTGKIPRGKGKAPQIVRPKNSLTPEGLQQHLEATKKTISELRNINADRFFLHPYFGNLKLKDTIRFLEIHTNHHLKIIEDIVNGKNN